MVGCESGDSYAIEWFHLKSVGLSLHPEAEFHYNDFESNIDTTKYCLCGRG